MAFFPNEIANIVASYDATRLSGRVNVLQSKEDQVLQRCCLLGNKLAALISKNSKTLVLASYEKNASCLTFNERARIPLQSSFSSTRTEMTSCHFSNQLALIQSRDYLSNTSVISISKVNQQVCHRHVSVELCLPDPAAVCIMDSYMVVAPKYNNKQKQSTCLFIDLVLVPISEKPTKIVRWTVDHGPFAEDNNESAAIMRIRSKSEYCGILHVLMSRAEKVQLWELVVDPQHQHVKSSRIVYHSTTPCPLDFVFIHDILITLHQFVGTNRLLLRRYKNTNDHDYENHHEHEHDHELITRAIPVSPFSKRLETDNSLIFIEEEHSSKEGTRWSSLFEIS